MKKTKTVQPTAKPKGLEVMLANGDVLFISSAAAIKSGSVSGNFFTGMTVVNVNKLTIGGGMEVSNRADRSFIQHKIVSIKATF